LIEFDFTTHTLLVVLCL